MLFSFHPTDTSIFLSLHALLLVTASSTTTFMSSPLVVGTRLHLGNALTAPDAQDLASKMANFCHFCRECCHGAIGVIAVDATPKIEDYNLVDAVTAICAELKDERIHILPVTPWGEFVSALNAMVIYARKRLNADRILFISAETAADSKDIQQLLAHLEPDTLVVGARLAGHALESECVALSGTTSPWNTLAVWDLKKLSLTGFQLVSDGLLTDDKEEPSFGIEEVVAIALLQKLLGKENAKAKLVSLKNVNWQIDSFQDPERRKWQEEKMKSKDIRAQRQLDLIGLTGEVYHY